MYKYGDFKYQNIALGAKENAYYTINKSLQKNSQLGHLNFGVEPYDVASFEENAYITTEPKPLILPHPLGGPALGVITQEVSDENGEFKEPIIITAQLDKAYSIPGITINSRNIIQEIEITTYKDDYEDLTQTFSATENNYFYDFGYFGKFCDKIVFKIKKIDKPHHFFGIFNIEYGEIKPIDEKVMVSGEIAENFSLVGDTLPYNSLDLTIYSPDINVDFISKKHTLSYFLNETLKSNFFINTAEKRQDETIQILAYNEIADLEGDFLGGMFNDYPLVNILTEILDTEKKWTWDMSEELWEIKVTGFLPKMSRRKALQTLLLGSNIRCFPLHKLWFSKLPEIQSLPQLTEKNIIQSPEKTKKQQIKSVTVRHHTYSKGAEEKEIYHWYMSTTEYKTLTFAEPMHSLKAYEVIGVDENGQDIVSATESPNVIIDEYGSYCTVSNSSSNKIVIKGLNYIDNVVEYKKINSLAGGDAEEITVDLTICSNPQEVCDLLFDLYSRENSIKFQTLQKPQIGSLYNILGERYNIVSVINRLNGIYEVEGM